MSAGDWKDLYQAAFSGDLALVSHHIREGVNPNYQHPEIMCTPLVTSVVEGHLAVAHYLLDHGADPHLVSDFHGLTPLEAARQCGHAELVQRLQGMGARTVRRPFWWRWLPV